MGIALTSQIRPRIEHQLKGIEHHQLKVPGETDNPWKHDILDDTDTNQRKEPKDPKRTLFY